MLLPLQTQCPVLDDVKLGALVALVAVALGICIAYLALDRLRHRNELERHVEKLNTFVDPIRDLLQRKNDLTTIEKCYVSFQYYCKNEDCFKDIKEEKIKKFDGSVDSVLETLLLFIAFVQIDRWALKVISLFLYAALVWITVTILHGNHCGDWINGNIAEDALMVLVILSYGVPAAASVAGGSMIKMSQDAVKRHIKDATATQTRLSASASIPNVNGH